MKRLLSLLITLSVLGVSISLSLALFAFANWEVNRHIKQQVEDVHAQVADRFRIFDELIANDEKVLQKQARHALVKLTDQLMTKDNMRDWSSDELQILANQYQVDGIYIIDPDTRIIATNFLPDLNFELGTITDHFNDYLRRLYGTGRLEVDRINVSSKTGMLKVYAYYAPANSDYIFEISYDVKKFLTQSHSPRYVDFMFGDFFTELTQTNSLLDKIDIYLINNYNAFPFLNDTEALKKSQLPAIPDKGVITVENVRDDKLYYYSRAELDRSHLHSAEYLVIRSTFNLDPITYLLHKFIGINIVVVIIILGLSFLLLSFLFDRWILRRIFRIVAALERSAEGDYHDRITSDRRDEIGLISEHVNSMNKRLAHREEQLKEAQQTLEHRVEERTSDLISEIEARKLAEKKLIELAETDPLTGVLNRRAFDQQAALEIERAKRYSRDLAVILLDIDHFKQINDQYGHSAGDEVLVTIANLIIPCLRGVDRLCRHGGEEFIILLPETSAEQAMLLGERLRREIAQQAMQYDDRPFAVTASFGITTWQAQEANIQPAIVRADKAMYRAKNQGRNQTELFEEHVEEQNPTMPLL